MAEETFQAISWEFPEFEQPARSRKWWVWFIILDLAIFLFAIFSANYTFAMIVVMISIIIIYRHFHEAEAIECILDKQGVVLGGKLYPWKEIKNFWFVYEPPQVKNLYLSFKSALRPTLRIPLVEQNPVLVREFLSQYLTEDLTQENEPTTDALGRLLKL